MTPKTREVLEQQRVNYLKMAEVIAKQLAEESENADNERALKRLIALGEGLEKQGPFSNIEADGVSGETIDKAFKEWKPNATGDILGFYPNLGVMTNREYTSAANALYKAVKQARWARDFAVAKEVMDREDFPYPTWLARRRQEADDDQSRGEATPSTVATQPDGSRTTASDESPAQAGDRRRGERRQEGSHNPGYYRRAYPKQGRRNGPADRRIEPVDRSI